jgi:single-strand DNA-binding protein
MNNITLIGNVATDVTLKHVGEQGTPVASFLLAVNRPGKDKGADFIPVKTWNGSAEAVSQYVRKGHKVAVEGSLRSSRYEKDGENRTSYEVVGRVQFLTPKSDAGDPNIPAPSSAEPTDDDIPF